MVVRRMLTNLFRYRYRDIRLSARAVKDFLRGPKWLMEQDAEKLHQEIVAAGYRYCEEYEGQWEERNEEVLAGLLAAKVAYGAGCREASSGDCRGGLPLL